MPVELRSTQQRVRLDVRRLRRDAEKMLDGLGCSERILSILVTDDRQIEWLHLQWMGLEGPTDVMSFPMDSGAGPGPAPWVLGDIVISAETAARRKPRDPQAEVTRYLIHGLLHLVGYDHRLSSQRLRMNRRAQRLQKLVCDSP